MRQMKCLCGKPAQWVEMPPEHPHKYRVRCPNCDKTVKWGGQAELDGLAGTDTDETLLPYEEQQVPAPDPFAAFYVKE